MRALVQRVSSASVVVAGEQVGSISRGILALVGVPVGATPRAAVRLAEKIGALRIFEDAAGKMDLSVVDVGGEVLVVSQFTLYGDASRGNRPSFTSAATRSEAEPLVDLVAQTLRKSVARVETGSFGARMEVALVNDGPVTLMLEV